MNSTGIGFQGVSPGFHDPVADSQTVFRQILDAMAHPGRVVAVPAEILPENAAGLSEAAAALALTLLDFETPVWLDLNLPRAGDFFRFHCGAPLVETPNKSRFAFATDLKRLPALTDFDLGTPDFPERSTTLVIEVPALAEEPGLLLSGPGIRTMSRLRVGGLPSEFWRRRGDLAAVFPLGIDLVLTCGRMLAALPRTTHVEI